MHALATSRATWKIVASDLPIGLLVPDGTAWEAVANGVDGPPSGREAEIAWVLHSLHRRRVRNVVWLTTDVHYAAAHRYSPAGAALPCRVMDCESPAAADARRKQRSPA